MLPLILTCIHSPLDLSEEHVHVMTALLSALKDGLTLIKKQNGVVDFGLSEDELEVLSSRHATQRGEVDQENLGGRKRGGGREGERDHDGRREGGKGGREGEREGERWW